MYSFLVEGGPLELLLLCEEGLLMLLVVAAISAGGVGYPPLLPSEQLVQGSRMKQAGVGPVTTGHARLRIWEVFRASCPGCLCPTFLLILPSMFLYSSNWFVVGAVLL